jgi:hypothetical protein
MHHWLVVQPFCHLKSNVDMDNEHPGSIWEKPENKTVSASKAPMRTRGSSVAPSLEPM